ncbi:hypothetical protein BJF93_18860 [Xaviernesmea oryzae]|uniref:TadE-like domain-containing protein n=1 Tax=Xaviernesmea oryzae TaxID=464029 RepID=A0A1Q9B2P5_9HYPH|nr:TadE/TadG family type IV pilus assembly protein [Xaviernesmea oryzae]OLP62276.1 hypothetical protein BJF93_18860 [Xaviernesmea oryzae]SEL94268.1 Flp pilus assembly protein TadG [Xaviernesmea oryzae]
MALLARLRRSCGLEALVRLSRERRGSGAVEFAFLAPILILCYLGAFETSVGFGVARKVAHACATVADLLSQSSSVNIATLDSMPTVVKSVMAPYDPANYALKVTGIAVTSSTEGTVKWSRDQSGGTPYRKESTVTIPGDVGTVGSFVVRAELSLPYHLKTIDMIRHEGGAGALTISKTYYFRQRIGSGITCSNCP